MAKRKRLSPATMHLDAPLETTSALGAPSLLPSVRAPIADVARDASAQAALEELSDTIVRARAQGRMVLSVPLSAIVLDHLVRDRVALDDEAMTSLKSSLKARGQQTPIEVMALEGGRYGLISGWRRCKALTALHAETGEAQFGEVLALLRQPDDAAEAYLAMVEENEIRVGLSYFERARIAAKSVEQGVFETQKIALQTLYKSASRTKRSKIGSFIRIVEALDGHLRFPEAIGERFGLLLSKALDEVPSLGPPLVRRLAAEAPATGEEELAILTQSIAPPKVGKVVCAGQNKISNAVSNKTLNKSIESKLESLAPNIDVVKSVDGHFLIAGTGVDAELRSALVAWLKAYR